ncbi:uncharacterized protein LOC103311924 [Acyrthosiphon pisum]|uniref:DUF4371 domain-containing protein n=1 Tax=Acyrthosiphon pisum TaxID=7029 RepID=A0A8R2FFG8_ACYPI|nr:uncharacterized protein LOC103311924 [Acyrthosiphon pisum]|eukprot:XP_008189985.1 PREDICTED: uncharacterized protein LOC103311924 [Acyrthosiphon pisum]
MESDTQEPIASTSGTQKPKKWAYTHKYQTAWESNAKFCKWISVSKKGDSHFHCRTCACDCKGGISAVQKHNSSKKHIELSSNAKVDSVFNMPSMIKQKAVLKNIKETEIRIASFVVEHNIPINVSDHIVSLINSIQLQPKYLAKLTCDRTKCTAIINNVIAITGFEDLVNYLKTNKFSLLVDESTDISSVKNLAMVVRTCQNF